MIALCPLPDSPTLRGCQVFGRHMIERRQGRIINIASMGSFLALFEVAAYCASKGRRSLADEVPGRRVGALRNLCQRHRARIFPNRFDGKAFEVNPTWRRNPDAHTDETLRRIGRVGRSRSVPRLRRRQLRNRFYFGCGRRLSRQRSEPVNVYDF